MKKLIFLFLAFSLTLTAAPKASKEVFPAVNLLYNTGCGRAAIESLERAGPIWVKGKRGKGICWKKRELTVPFERSLPETIYQVYRGMLVAEYSKEFVDLERLAKRNQLSFPEFINRWVELEYRIAYRAARDLNEEIKGGALPVKSLYKLPGDWNTFVQSELDLQPVYAKHPDIRGKKGMPSIGRVVISTLSAAASGSLALLVVTVCLLAT